ncbi:hypothetical protein KKH43_03390 [Patescibacteria group bacterium]|nr:hypothetical protein [Patescibacteria group bacterium]
MKFKIAVVFFSLALFLGGCSLPSATNESLDKQRKETIFKKRIQEKMETIDTSEWETYQDEENGYEYEFKYSSSFWGQLAFLSEEKLDNLELRKKFDEVEMTVTHGAELKKGTVDNTLTLIHNEKLEKLKKDVLIDNSDKKITRYQLDLEDWSKENWYYEYIFIENEDKENVVYFYVTAANLQKGNDTALGYEGFDKAVQDKIGDVIAQMLKIAEEVHFLNR